MMRPASPTSNHSSENASFDRSFDAAIRPTSEPAFDAAFEHAVWALRRGEAIVFPTDTVYGLGIAVRFCESPAVLYRLKKRAAEKPVAWLVGGPDDLLRYGANVPPAAVELAKAFWAGPLTLVVQASEAVPPAFRSREGTIGLRMPDSPIPLALIAAVGSPLATTSANLSGGRDPQTAADLPRELSASAACVLTADAALSGVPSTVLDCSKATIKVLREGAIDVSAFIDVN